MSAITQTIKGLEPPASDGTRIDRTLMWRMTVSAFVAFLFAAFLWSVGVFTSLGYPGFAHADQLDAVLQELQAQKVTRLEVELRELQKSYCTATDSRSADYWLSERDKRRGEYFSMTRREYPLPTCGELGPK